MLSNEIEIEATKITAIKKRNRSNEAEFIIR